MASKTQEIGPSLKKKKGYSRYPVTESKM